MRLSFLPGILIGATIIWNAITGSHYFRYLNTYFIPCRLKNTAFIVFVLEYVITWLKL